jgi:dienelactone hydrolase
MRSMSPARGIWKVVAGVIQRAVFVTACALFACAGARQQSQQTSQSTSQACSEPPANSVESLGDLWIGGFGRTGGHGAFLRVDFSADIARLDPRDGLAPLGLIHPKLGVDANNNPKVQFSIDDGLHRHTFDLERSDTDTLEGTVVDAAGESGTARIFRLATDDRKRIDAAFSGTYAVDGDRHRLLFVEDGRLFDTSDGSERRLYLLRDGRVLVGAGVAIPHPAFGIATLDASQGLRIERTDGATLLAPRLEVTRTEVRFAASDGVVLVGTLLSPRAAGPHPAVVYVHGSGHSTRKDAWENAFARFLISKGLAVLLYDKRGVGDSGGEYVGAGGRDTNNVSTENLERLAGDARAALAMMASRAEIDPSRLGLIGLSQAGWIIPLAAKATKSARFAIILSGPTVHTSIQLAYQTLVGPGESCMPNAAVEQVVHDHAPRTGFDPAPSIASLEIPVLWIYGGVDALVPVHEAVHTLELLKKTHDFTWQIVPGAGHELFVVPRDNEEQRQFSRGLSPMVLDTIRTWLAAHHIQGDLG